jgi:hypothetical protein
MMLLLTLAPVVVLAEFLAVIVDFGIEQLGAPAALGGILVAILVLSPEGLTALHAALENQLQRRQCVSQIRAGHDRADHPGGNRSRDLHRPGDASVSTT